MSHFHVSPGFRQRKAIKVPGAMGCMISHLVALRQAYLAGHELVVITEDDITWEPFEKIVAAHTHALLAEGSSRSSSNASETRAFFEAVASCAAKAGEGGAEGGGDRPVVVQLMSLRDKSYYRYDAWKGRDKLRNRENRHGKGNKHCVDTRFNCPSLLERRKFKDYGTQAVLWNRAAVEYAVNLYWKPGPDRKPLSAIVFPEHPTRAIKTGITDVDFYSFPAPFGETFRLAVPVAHVFAKMHHSSSVAVGQHRGGDRKALQARAAVQAYTHHILRNCFVGPPPCPSLTSQDFVLPRDKERCVSFLQIPKTGTETMMEILDKEKNHFGAQARKNELRKCWTFVTVRNPWDRLRSWHDYCTAGVKQNILRIPGMASAHVAGTESNISERKSRSHRARVSPKVQPNPLNCLLARHLDFPSWVTLMLADGPDGTWNSNPFWSFWLSP
eukprot:310020-Rhodomonas_salina.1